MVRTGKQLKREEYIEQEYFFRTYRERIQDSVPSQDIFATLHEEILSTCRLPVAVDILRTEMLHSGQISPAMRRMPHYFTAFQTYVIERAEDDRSRFELITGLQILEREARYRADEVSCAGLFMFQFECLVRNRLGYHSGLSAMAADDIYGPEWKEWFQYVTLQLGAYSLAELVYRASDHFQRRKPKTSSAPQSESQLVLFGDNDGRIARANIGRDPMYFFSALQRQLNYPTVPIPPRPFAEKLSPVLEGRLTRIEQRLKLLEMESKGGIDLSKFYGQHRNLSDSVDEKK